MSKVEELAKKYCEGSSFEDACMEKPAYIAGYHQAERDLIDKAVGWIGEIYNYHEIMRYSDSCKPPLSELTEWFKNYIKEGGKDE